MSRHQAGRQAGSYLLRAIRSGTSGAEVFLLRQPDGATVATKVTRNPRVSSSLQAQRHALMAKHFASHTPAVLGTATEAALDVIVTAAPAVWSLDESDDGLIPLTLGEVRRLLAHLITATRAFDHVHRRSRWRRRHQYRAKTVHYQRRLLLHQVRLEY
jgi:hypothetical protein